MTFAEYNSNWYATDPNGDIVFTPNKPSDMTNVLTREVDTGELADDPTSKQTYYTLNGQYTRDVAGRGWRLDATHRRLKREARNYILSHPEIYGVQSRRDLRSDATRDRLTNLEYATKRQALYANNYLYPTYKKKEVDWNWVKKPIVSTEEVINSCPDCGPGISKTYQDKVIGNVWALEKNVGNLSAMTDIDENTRYTRQLPVMRTEYAVPLQGREEIITETEQVPVASKVTQAKPRTTTPSHKRTATTKSRPKASVSKPVVTEVTRRKLVKYDPAGNVIEEKYLKTGGKLNYFDYFNL